MASTTQQGISIEEKFVLWGGLGLVTFLGIKYLGKAINNAQRNNEIKKLDDGQHTSHSTSFAAMLYSAFFQGGAEWLSDWFGDGTNQELVYQVAREMHQSQTSFSQVSKSYRALYNRDLFQDLQKELSSEEQQRFNSLLKTGLNGIKRRYKSIKSRGFINRL